MSDINIYITIIGMALVSYFSRELPFVLLKGRNLNPVIMEWMSYIPTAVLGALLVPGIIITENHFNISLSNDFLIAGIATIIFGSLVNNLFAVIIFGIGFLSIIRNFF